ncbi:DUF805 domain-containing protein [Hasllibacter sp. MH4015]|uniref:DUF805 domain-containing protein n=1 Tax=Hasllibacter sp. MH4015 TaxID=2854029 RepID=UPI001CD5909A|nr:DUF805 domain-containing protein [Hasllibacter sp. MH4015]
MTKWYYSDGQDRFGPVDAAEMERLIENGTITATTLVWREGLDGWVDASSEFASAGGGTTAPPPMPAQGQPAGATTPMTARTAPSDAGGDLGSDGLYVGAPSRSFGEAISVCFSKFVTFQGRASRSEYWFFVLFTVLVGIVTSVIDLAVFPNMVELSPLNSVANLILFLPGLAVAIRRLHDTNRSGWWIGAFYLAMVVFGVILGALIAVDPGVGEPEGIIALFGLFGIGVLVYAIVLIVFLCTKGTPGPNRFG